MVAGHLDARAQLERMGYAVLDAESAEEAERVSASHDGEIALLLTDVRLPGTGGPALARTFAAGRPGLRVLYMTGYSDDALKASGEFETGMEVLAKPFSLAVLAERVGALVGQDDHRGQ